MVITNRKEIRTILDQIYDMHKQTSFLPLDISHCMQLPRDYAVGEWVVKFSNLETHTCVKAHTIYQGITTSDELWEWYIEFLSYFLYKKLAEAIQGDEGCLETP